MSDHPKTKELKRIIASWPKAERAILSTLNGEELPDLEPTERWEYLKLLVRHRLLVGFIKSLVIKYPNTPIAKRGLVLKKSYMKHQLMLSAEILKLAKLFDKADIRYIALKGPILSEILYGEVSQRQSTDIDVLIDPSDVRPCIQLLQDQGYYCQENIADLGKKYFDTFLELTDELTLISNTSSPVKVDLHWKITTPIGLFPMLDKSLWDYTELHNFNGLEVPVISQELNFIYLCLHGAKHKWFRLQWLMDVDSLLMQELDWRKIVEIVEKNKISRSIGQAALLCEVLLNTEIPETLKHLISKSPEIYGLTKSALAAIRNDESFMSAADRRNIGHLTSNLMRLKQGLRYKLSCLERLLISPKDWETVKLPHQLILLYIPLRPFLLLIRKFKNV